MTELTKVAVQIQALLAQQLTRISFHFNDVENDYRTTEHRLSTAMLDANLNDQQHLACARRIIELSEEYKRRFLAPLQALRPELQHSIDEFDRAFHASQSQMRTEDRTGTSSWLNLTRELAGLRSALIDAIGSNIDFDTRSPKKIVEHGGKIDITLTAEESRRFREDLAACSEVIKNSHEREQEIDAQREALTARLFSDDSAAPRATSKQQVIAPPVIHPLEGRPWFRFLKVLYWASWIAGLGVVAFVASVESNIAILFIGGCVVAAILLLVKQIFYYVALGRTSALEKPGRGFVDLEELQTELSRVRIENPDIYERIAAPAFADWQKRYGRRIPVHELRLLMERVDQELEEIRDKRREITDKAARGGATIDVRSLRDRMEKTKLTYKGADAAAYSQALDRFIVSLEVKYGQSIPIDEAERLLGELENDIQASEAKST
jgi:hypothetical protein